MNKNYNFKFNKKNGNQFTEKLDIYKQNPENNEMLIIMGASLVFFPVVLVIGLFSELLNTSRKTTNSVKKRRNGIRISTIKDLSTTDYSGTSSYKGQSTSGRNARI